MQTGLRVAYNVAAVAFTFGYGMLHWYRETM